MSETETRGDWTVRVTVPAHAPNIRDEVFDIVADAVADAEEATWGDRDGWDLHVEAGPDDLAAARAEVARLREAGDRLRVAIARMADDWEELGIDGMPSIAELRSLLAPVEPSGEAESGEDEPWPSTRAALAAARAARSAPVSSGGQADGERQSHWLERWVAERAARKDAEQRLADVLAARPVLSREALRERIDPLVDGFIREWVPPAMQGHLLDDDGNAGERLREALADVLAGEQR